MGHIGTFGVNPTLYPKLPYDAVKDFQPITLFAMIPNLMSVNPSLPAKIGQGGDRTRPCQARRSELRLRRQRLGSASRHRVLQADDQDRHRAHPLQGHGPGDNRLLAGNISMIITGVPAQLGHIKSGRLRATRRGDARKRLPLFPELPTIAEAGVKGYEATQWYAVTRSRQHAQAGRREAQRNTGQGAAGRGCEGTARDRGRRTRRQFARGVPRLHPEGNCALGPGDQGVWSQTGITTPVSNAGPDPRE